MRLVIGNNVLYAERLKVRESEIVDNVPDANIALLKGQSEAGITYMKGLGGFGRTIRRTYGLLPGAIAVPAMDGGEDEDEG